MSTPPSGGGVGVGGVKNENFLKNAQNGLKHLENEFGVILSTFFFDQNGCYGVLGGHLKKGFLDLWSRRPKV